MYSLLYVYLETIGNWMLKAEPLPRPIEPNSASSMEARE